MTGEDPSNAERDNADRRRCVLDVGVPAGFGSFVRAVRLDQDGLEVPHVDRLRALCERYGIHLAE